MKPAKRTLVSKWTKTKRLLQNRGLRKFIPETRLFSRTNLLYLLKKYRMIYVKPVKGSGGKGVIRAEVRRIRGKTLLRYQQGTTIRTFTSFGAFYASLYRTKFPRPYLVQQGIPLLTLQGRPFDIRVMVQRTATWRWRTTGIIGRLAHPKRAVTNYHSQGRPLPLRILFASRLSPARRRRLTTSLARLGLRIAHDLGRKYPGFRELGVDVGMDARLHPWVLEVNTAPDARIFNELKNKRIFRRVLLYAKANGRYKSRKLPRV
ncbi:YheC/YheD family protein [Paenibacillus caseinilyticus]|uniref:Endospore coat-associated protein yheC n=1 Tax=Paenibacillus mucilaginosus K02 TaxID=997761 RepID=I0BCR7_9BACL|nr:YheC/YheD family protein [Paenibacillus mucilaginosus]AFH60164.1 endospore coat-associated protein yheC [Paenibacillus mucilaginosus K02]